jgi:hypothetical protein
VLSNSPTGSVETPPGYGSRHRGTRKEQGRYKGGTREVQRTNTLSPPYPLHVVRRKLFYCPKPSDGALALPPAAQSSALRSPPNWQSNLLRLLHAASFALLIVPSIFSPLARRRQHIPACTRNGRGELSVPACGAGVRFSVASNQTGAAGASSRAFRLKRPTSRPSGARNTGKN